MKKAEKIHIKLNYDSEVAVIPSSALKFIDRAKKFDIKVLCVLASSDTFRTENGISRIAQALECNEQDVEASVSFWNGTGVIDLCAGQAEKAKIEEKPPQSKEEAETKSTVVPKRTKVSELPQYTTEELNKMLEHHEGVCELIDESQQILGKIFNTADVKILMGLVDFLGLDNEYILVLMHYCAEIDKRSMRYLERVAVSCLDDGITEAKVLQETLRAREEKKETENKIRSIFGIGSRALTKKEKGFVAAWISTYGFDFDIISKAYEITVNATGNASVPYANAILEKWYTEGLKTLDEIDAYLAKFKEEKGEGQSSFELDEFFNAAISRSYSDKKQGG